MPRKNNQTRNYFNGIKPSFLKIYKPLKISLTEKEITILKYRLSGLTLAEIGKQVHVTPERVRVVETRAIRKADRLKRAFPEQFELLRKELG